VSRHSVDVIASGMMVVTKKVRKDLGGGHLGTRQIRRTHNVVTDARLSRINSCMGSEMAGKSFASLGAVQDAFKKARQGPCKI